MSKFSMTMSKFGGGGGGGIQLEVENSRNALTAVKLLHCWAPLNILISLRTLLVGLELYIIRRIPMLL